MKVELNFSHNGRGDTYILKVLLSISTLQYPGKFPYPKKYPYRVIFLYPIKASIRKYDQYKKKIFRQVFNLSPYALH